MLPDGPISGWNSIEETPVPVRSGGTSPAVNIASSGPAHDISETERGDVHIGHGDGHPVNPHAMTLSAVMGVLLALGGVGIYFGIGGVSLQGDLTGSGGSQAALSITDAGQFDPENIAVHPGDTVTITNRNADPQVLKPKNSRDLFPVQVVFDQPYTFTVPADAAGEYVYYSETLPEDRTITFTVTPQVPVETAGASSSSETLSSSASSDTISIPLPFGGGSVDIAPTNTAAPAPVQTTTPVTIQPSEHSGDTATISIGAAISSSVSSSRPGSGSIPTNPYTVGTAPKETSIASSAAGLHSGAPLLVQNIRPPKRTTDSGTGGFALLFIPAFLGVMFVSRRMFPVA